MGRVEWDMKEKEKKEENWRTKKSKGRDSKEKEEKEEKRRTWKREE